MSEWLTIEVFNGSFAASQCWGVVLELAFADDERRDRFRSLATVRAALDAVPDPLTGLLVGRGRGGGSGARVPRKPKPAPIAGAVTADVPEDVVIVLEYAVTGIQRDWNGSVAV